MKILVVKDEKIVLHDLPTRLHAVGYTVLTSASGEDAIDMTAAQHPDVVLTDSIRASEPLSTQAGIPVICFTAHPDELAFCSRMNPYTYLRRWRF